MKYWWVNQNKTYKHEVGNNYLWSPKTKANGHDNRACDNMTEVQAGNLVFSFCDKLIKAVGVAIGKAEESPRPKEFDSGDVDWADVGWRVPVEFKEIDWPIRPGDHMDILGPVRPPKYSPIQPSGVGNRGVYLADISDEFGRVLEDLLDGQVIDVLESVAQPNREILDDQEAKYEIEDDPNLEETTRSELHNARIGQGPWRSRVLTVEKKCRVTGVGDPQHLRASHIKPWRHSDNTERLDRHNGLMLAPHIDHLFDRLFISFAENGRLLVSNRIDESVLEAWNITANKMTGVFTSGQKKYPTHHRSRFLRKN